MFTNLIASIGQIHDRSKPAEGLGHEFKRSFKRYVCRNGTTYCMVVCFVWCFVWCSLQLLPTVGCRRFCFIFCSCFILYPLGNDIGLFFWHQGCNKGFALQVEHHLICKHAVNKFQTNQPNTPMFSWQLLRWKPRIPVRIVRIPLFSQISNLLWWRISSA